MILTYAVYISLIVIILWGCKFAGINRYNDDFLEKDITKSIRGLAAILIILHHISQRPAFQDVTKEIFFFNEIGFLFVTIFFFSSGYGLTISSKNNPNFLDKFISKRLPRLLFPFFVTNIIFAIYKFFLGYPLPRIILGIFGLVNINENGWYPIVITIMYLVFYFAQKCFKKDPSRLIIYILASLIMICIFCVNGHFAWWADKPGWWLSSSGFNKASWWMQQNVLWFSGEWWVNSSIAFSVGAAFAMYKKQIVSFFKKGYWIKLLVCIILFASSYIIFNKTNYKVGGYWTEFGRNTPEIATKFKLSALQLPASLFFTIMIQVILMKFETKNPITSFFGKIAYETYLIGVIVLDGFDFLIFKKYSPIIQQPYNYNLAIYLLCVVFVTTLLGYLLNKLNNYLLSKINK